MDPFKGTLKGSWTVEQKRCNLKPCAWRQVVIEAVHAEAGELTENHTTARVQRIQ